MKPHGVALLALSCLFAVRARAEPLRVDRSGETLKVDGMLREWRGAHFTMLGEREDGRVRYALATTDAGLYLGAEVHDERRILGLSGDALILTLALPVGAGPLVPWELSLYPGDTGQAAHAMLSEGKRAPRVAPRVEVVEGPRDAGQGYVIEAFVPTAALGEAATWGDALWEQARGSLRFRDVDERGKTTVVETESGKDPGALPRIALGQGQRDLLGSFLAAKHLGQVEPRYDFRADVAGDARLERVAVVDRYVVVYGPGYAGGVRSGFYALPYASGGGVEDAAPLDLTADGRAELTIRVRQPEQGGQRTVFMVLDLDESKMAPSFSVEVKRELRGGFVENALTIVSKGQRVPRIDVALGRSAGVDASTYRAPDPGEAIPLLVPWGEVESRSFAYDGTRFSVVGTQQRVAPVDRRLAVAPTVAMATEAKRPIEPVAAEDPLLAYKSKVGLPAGTKPTRTLVVKLLPGARGEHVALFGTDIVVTGPTIGDGRGYLSYRLPITDPSALLELRAVALSGGVGDELLVRVKQELKGADGVERELLLVLRGDENGRIVRALVAEVARRQGERVIENRLSLHSGALVREPGAAKGWTAKSYPFDTAAIGGAERLLLPWSDRPVRYQTEGNALRAESSVAR